MGVNFKDLAAIVNASIARNTKYIEPRIMVISMIATVCFPLYYIVWHYIFPQPYENLTLRLVGAALFVPSIFLKRWPEWMNKYKSIYWYLATLYTLPFFFIFMLLKNDGSDVWSAATLVALFLMLLWLDWLNIIIQTFFGATLASIAYFMTTSNPQIHFHTLEYIPIFLFAIVVGIATNYSSETLRQERLRAMLATANTVAHELRTPLLGIRSGAAGLRQFLPALLDAYQMAKNKGLLVEPIRLAHLHSMHGVLERIEAEANHSNIIIDMLLMNTRLSGVKSDNFSLCSISQCVETALQRYSFASEQERERVVWNNGTDFKFLGIELLMVHVLFNLIKNSLYYIAKAGKGRIFISVGKSQSGNLLIFKDTGSGVPPEILPYIFTQFYSWSPDNDNRVGAGIGLAFCRNVMTSFSGSIHCQSQLGEYTEFTLTFPSPTPEEAA